MQPDFRPHISRIYKDVWNTRSGEHISGIVLFGYSGIAAHLTKSEAFALADRIVDAAENLPDLEPVRRIESHGNNIQRISTVTRPRLTAADGTEEIPLPTSPAESE